MKDDKLWAIKLIKLPLPTRFVQAIFRYQGGHVHANELHAHSAPCPTLILSWWCLPSFASHLQHRTCSIVTVARLGTACTAACCFQTRNMQLRARVQASSGKFLCAGKKRLAFLPVQRSLSLVVFDPHAELHVVGLKTVSLRLQHCGLTDGGKQ